MKILDRYILRSYLKIFFAVFFILTIIFVFQTVWLYISELAGKDLTAGIIFKFLLYFTPNLMPLILPLTILVTSIMTFGNFAEKYEFAAMKSAGISLQRAMRSLIFFIFGIAILAFFFANNIIPIAAYKSINLRKNIAKLQPSMAIVEGAFNDIGNINIKVEEKSGSNDQFLKDVIIHKSNESRKGNFTVIKAKRGELVGSTDSDMLSLILYDGNYYNEVYKRNYREKKKKPFAKSYFEEYTINIDLSKFNQVDLGDENYSGSYKMLKSGELMIEIDSLVKAFNKNKQQFKANIKGRTGFDRLDTSSENETHFSNEYNGAVSMLEQEDTATKKTEPVESNKNLIALKKEEGQPVKKLDSSGLKKESAVLKEDVKEPKEVEKKTLASIDEPVLSEYDRISKRQIINIAVGSLNGTIATISTKNELFSRHEERLNKFKMELYNKYVIGVACIILFFVGAPLGAIIRKGGMGLPLVVAILLFLTYHFVGVLAKNSAENGAIDPFIASWLSTFIMFPLSVFLTYRATTDQGFFNSDIIMDPIRKFIRKIKNSKKG